MLQLGIFNLVIACICCILGFAILPLLKLGA